MIKKIHKKEELLKEPKLNDLKTFALIWSFIFSIIGLWPLIDNGGIRLWALAITLIFILIAFLKPAILKSFYKIWIKIGEFVGNIVSKVIMIILFYGMFTPTALVLKIFGKDLLRKKLDKNSPTYWIKRETQPGSLKNQF